MKLIVEGMTCGHCIRTITSAIQQLDASARVDVNLDNEEVNIASSVDVASAVKAIQDEGYIVVAILDGGSSSSGDEMDQARNCCGTCHA